MFALCVVTANDRYTEPRFKIKRWGYHRNVTHNTHMCHIWKELNIKTKHAPNCD